MKSLYKLSTGIFLIASHLTLAQNGSKIVPVFVKADPIVDKDGKVYDSLGEAYLQSGDTSMALYYFDKYLEANPHEEQTKTAIKRFRKLYTRYSNSFYLKEY